MYIKMGLVCDWFAVEDTIRVRPVVVESPRSTIAVLLYQLRSRGCNVSAAHPHR